MAKRTLVEHVGGFSFDVYDDTRPGIKFKDGAPVLDENEQPIPEDQKVVVLQFVEDGESHAFVFEAATKPALAQLLMKTLTPAQKKNVMASPTKKTRARARR